MPEHADLVRELRTLRKGRGLTPARLANCPALQEVLGADSPSDTHEALVRHVRALGDDMPALALRAALAVDLASPGNLTQRRNDYALSVERHVDTVEGYENRMIDELALKLLAAEGEPARAINYNVTMAAYVHNSHLKHFLVGRTVSSNAWPESWELYDQCKETNFICYRAPDDGPRSVTFRMAFGGTLPTLITGLVYKDLFQVLGGTGEQFYQLEEPAIEGDGAVYDLPMISVEIPPEWFAVVTWTRARTDAPTDHLDPA